jgi:virginiamycin B lyase
VRARVLAVVVSLLALLALAASAPAALTPTVTTFPSHSPDDPSSHPYSIAPSPDGGLWFTDPYAHFIERMRTDGTITVQSPVPALSFAYDITAGSDGAMWFVNQNPSEVGRIDESGAILTKAMASPTANPTHLTSGPDGALWIAESAGRIIGRIPAVTPLAAVDESRTTADGPNAIALGSDGNLWFTEYSASVVVRMTPAGVQQNFPLHVGYNNPEGIAAGPDGALWYTVLNPPTVVRLGIDGAETLYPLPPGRYPNEITAGPDDALWFAAGDVVGRITTDGSYEGFPLPSGVGLNRLAAGPDGNVWFTESNAGRIGRITTPPNASTGGVAGVGPSGGSAGGTVNGHSQPTDVKIEYGPVGGALTTSAAVHLSASGADQPVSIALSHLTPSTPYTYRVVATNGTGTTSGSFQTFSTARAVIDRISALKMSPTSFTAAAKGPSITTAAKRRAPGAVVSYTGTQEATTRFTVQRPARGRLQGRRCVKPSPRNRTGKRCTRYIAKGGFSHTDAIGANSFRFSGRARGHKLTPGRYRLRAVPRNAAGAGGPAYRKFRIKR